MKLTGGNNICKGLHFPGHHIYKNTKLKTNNKAFSPVA